MHAADNAGSIARWLSSPTLTAILSAVFAACTGACADAAAGARCADLAPTCAAHQQSCVERAGGATCEPCGAGTYLAAGGTCEVIGGTPLAHEFPDQTVKPGEEQLGNCRSWTVGNDVEIWVDAIELGQTEHSHHSNWVYVPEGTFAGPDGIWACHDRGYDFYTAVQAGGLLYAPSPRRPRTRCSASPARRRSAFHPTRASSATSTCSTRRARPSSGTRR